MTWTYEVANTGNIGFLAADVQVTDDVIGPVTNIVDMGDGILAPGETWIYQASGPADVLTFGSPQVVDGCGDGRPMYENLGQVVGTTTSGSPVTDDDPSHYCNPLVDAKITIEPDDTNEVGDPHTFTVTVMEDDGVPAGAPGGDAFAGFAPAVGESVTLTLSGINGASPTPAGPVVGVTDANGQFAVTFMSATAGQVVGSASTVVLVGGRSLSRAMDGSGDNSGPATKAYVDAKIVISPDDTNEVGDPHTFTVTVWEDDGSGIDADGMMGTFDRAAGESVSVSLSGSNGATPLAQVRWRA